MSEHKYQHMHLGVNTLFHVPGDVGGTEIYLLELLKVIFKRYPSVRITLFTHSDNHLFMKDLFGNYPQASFYKLPFKARVRPLRIIAEQALLPIAVHRSEIDVLWSPGYIAPAFLNCPQVVTVHDLQYRRHPEDMTFIERIVLDLLVKTACRRCEKILSVSEFSRREIIHFGFAEPEKVHATLEGVDPSFGSSAASFSSSIPEELSGDLEKETPYILCVAHTYPHKNVHLLIDAFGELKDSIPHTLVLVGKPRLGEQQVQEAVSRLGKDNRVVRFKQGVSFSSLKYLYQNTDVFVLPSVYEGFGLPVIEALMAGTPVVCTPEASLPEVAGDHALFVDSCTPENIRQKILEVLSWEDGQKHAHRKAAQQWASEFTWEKTAGITMDVVGGCVE